MLLVIESTSNVCLKYFHVRVGKFTKAESWQTLKSGCVVDSLAINGSYDMVIMWVSLLNGKLFRSAVTKPSSFQPELLQVHVYFSWGLQFDLGTMNQLFIDDNAVLFTYHFYVAGTETSAHSMSWLLLMMCLHQDVQKKVIDEIDQQIGECQHREHIFPFG